MNTDTNHGESDLRAAARRAAEAWSERELLELAALAADYQVHRSVQAQRDSIGLGARGLWIVGGSTCWNPRHSDGDALRLGAALHVNLLHLSFHSPEGHVQAGLGRDWLVSVPYGGDKGAAVREAIFQCAVIYGLARREAEGGEHG